MSIALLQDLHLLTREGQLNAERGRKLKQIRHLSGCCARRWTTRDPHAEPLIVDCGAGKSISGRCSNELVLGPASRGSIVAIEARPELSTRRRGARRGSGRPLPARTARSRARRCRTAETS